MSEIFRNSSWVNVIANLWAQEKSELLDLIKELYTLNKNNKMFIERRYLTITHNNSLAHYKKKIDESFYPDVKSRLTVNLSACRKAINDYKKAIKDTNGTIELMVHSVTIGTQFSLNYGGMNEEFYESLISMFHSVLKILVNADNNTKAKYIAELADVVHSARQINCGYYDEISDLLNDFFHENESK